MCEIKYTKKGGFTVAGFILSMFTYFKVCSASKREYGVNVFKTLHVWTTVEFCQSHCTVHFGKEGLTCQPKRDGSGAQTQIECLQFEIRLHLL